ncbi:MAG: hypothetical protein HY821_11825 [Acidobacteria bacterium]|nr:hypothetical protein [Acidobacteriota bacterium]
MSLEWREERTAPAECGVVEVCRLFEDAARRHATHLGFGVADLHAGGKAWVLSQLALRIVRLPAAGESLVVGTWPSRRTAGVRAWRDLELRTADGALLAEAASIWLIVDRGSKRVSRLPGTFSTLAFPAKDTGVAPGEAWAACGPADRVSSHLVVEADLDENLHANNVSYVGWAWAALEGRAGACRRLDVDYLGEGLLGDVVEIGEWVGDGVIRQELRVGERVVCRARWEV